jgi:hypothetical protein
LIINSISIFYFFHFLNNSFWKIIEHKY